MQFMYHFNKAKRFYIIIKKIMNCFLNRLKGQTSKNPSKQNIQNEIIQKLNG